MWLERDCEEEFRMWRRIAGQDFERFGKLNLYEMLQRTWNWLALDCSWKLVVKNEMNIRAHSEDRIWKELRIRIWIRTRMRIQISVCMKALLHHVISWRFFEFWLYRVSHTPIGISRYPEWKWITPDAVCRTTTIVAFYVNRLLKSPHPFLTKTD
jgi:hypothetical protein